MVGSSFAGGPGHFHVLCRVLIAVLPQPVPDLRLPITDHTFFDPTEGGSLFLLSPLLNRVDGDRQHLRHLLRLDDLLGHVSL
jgi:hypothetical protein